ncbi:hypothetical protein [Candidatus Viridilinea mediisalina]|uniref:Glycosyltransferase RgtA/B/C/D-like domain-containing protein n=1 Tax=Candidatus Viridilinea mediisalina TaxID=2024553 RepID=A0A2A6RJ29_9CHLR|nr:hypothetical protein [Candidatus Viridilinea mediisalina]PDW03134.1 hypothetical protein CJ255_10485 [Candidatus Viridilinea mediisalina]
MLTRISHSLPVLRLEHLWVIFALSLIAAFISMAPTAPYDFWWHLRAGALIGTEGLPTTNRFAWGVPPETPYVYQSWLGEWLFFQIYQLGGLPLVVFTRNLLGTFAFALVAYEAQRRSGSWRLAALAVLLAGFMTINNFNTRTQNWSWVPFMLTLIILGRYVDGRLAPRWLALLPLLMIFWVNAHGAFIMGLLVAGAFVVGESIRRLWRDPHALPWYRLRPLYLATAALPLAMLVNPQGFGIFTYLLTLLSDAPSQQLVVEWQSPTPRTLAGAGFYLGVLALLTAFALGRRRPTITDVILVCGLAWQSFIGIRYVVWFGMAAMPIMAQSLAAPRSLLKPSERSAARERGGGILGNWLVVICLALGVLVLQPWTKPLLPLPAEYQALFAPVPGAPQLFTAATPVEAVADLRTEPCHGPIFNEMGYGSYMAWALYPLARHYIDPRIELFPLELWEEYVAVSDGHGVAAFLEQHDIACVILDRPKQAGLAAIMPTLPGWQQSFANERSEVWRREE